MANFIDNYSQQVVELAQEILKYHSSDKKLVECFYKIKAAANNAPIELLDNSWPYLWRERKVIYGDIDKITDIDTSEANEHETLMYIIKTLKSDWENFTIIEKELFQGKVQLLLNTAVKYKKSQKSN